MHIRKNITRAPLLRLVWPVAFGSAVLGLTQLGTAAPATLGPTAATGQDTFVYQAMPTFNFDANGFQQFIVLGKSTAGHELDGLIKFDVTGLSLSAGETAALNLFVEPTASTGFPGISATAANPVTVDLAAATNAWNPASVTYGSVTSGPVFSQLAVNGDKQWISFDITAAVAGWIANPASNNGLVLTQDAAVFSSDWEGVVFDASAASVNQPYLQITPEPSVGGLAAVAGVLIGRRRRESSHA